MRRTSTTDKIVEKLQVLIKKKLDIELDTETVYSILDSQFIGLIESMRKGEAVKLDNLGKFMIKETRQKALDKLNVK